MEYQVVEKDGRRYIELDHIGSSIQAERDALDIVSICMENGTNLVLIQGDRLSDEFLQLKTGVAGAILQKFVLYNIKAVAVLGDDKVKGRFREFLVESNRGGMFRAYASLDEAESWLLRDVD